MVSVTRQERYNVRTAFRWQQNLRSIQQQPDLFQYLSNAVQEACLLLRQLFASRYLLFCATAHPAWGQREYGLPVSVRRATRSAHLLWRCFYKFLCSTCASIVRPGTAMLSNDHMPTRSSTTLYPAPLLLFRGLRAVFKARYTLSPVSHVPLNGTCRHLRYVEVITARAKASPCSTWFRSRLKAHDNAEALTLLRRIRGIF